MITGRKVGSLERQPELACVVFSCPSQGKDGELNCSIAGRLDGFWEQELGEYVLESSKAAGAMGQEQSQQLLLLLAPAVLRRIVGGWAAHGLPCCQNQWSNDSFRMRQGSETLLGYNFSFKWWGPIIVNCQARIGLMKSGALIATCQNLMERRERRSQQGSIGLHCHTRSFLCLSNPVMSTIITW
eukprot:1144295-Pelagomonas_calceolata.AAC.2